MSIHSYSKTLSRLSLSYLPADSSMIYRTQSLQLYSPSFGTNEFLVGKVVVKNNTLKWMCPRQNIGGSLSLDCIYEAMQHGVGVVYGTEEALEALNLYLPGKEVPSSLLFFLSASTIQLFLLFTEPDVLDTWANGEDYLDLLSVLQNFDIEELESLDESQLGNNTEQLWLFAVDHQKNNERITIEASFIDGNKESYHRKVFQLNFTDIHAGFQASLARSYIEGLGIVDTSLMDMYLLDSLRDRVLVSLSRDIITGFRPALASKIAAGKHAESIRMVKDWYKQNILSEYKIEQINLQIDCLSQELRDPLTQCFRVAEIQKLTLQIELTNVFNFESALVESRYKQLVLRGEMAGASEGMQESAALASKLCECLLF